LLSFVEPLLGYREKTTYLECHSSILVHGICITQILVLFRNFA